MRYRKLPETIERKLKQYYLSQTPSQGLKSQLLADDIAKLNVLQRPLFAGTSFLAGTMVAMLVLSISAVLFYLPNYLPSRSDSLLERVVSEILMNHQKQLSPDYLSNSIVQLNAEMTALDFKLKFPKNKVGHTILAGARYCSIQGQLAAQLRYTDASTVYVTQVNDELLSIGQQSVQIEGVQVSLWREDDLFFGLAIDIF